MELEAKDRLLISDVRRVLDRAEANGGFEPVSKDGVRVSHGLEGNAERVRSQLDRLEERGQQTVSWSTITPLSRRDRLVQLEDRNEYELHVDGTTDSSKAELETFLKADADAAREIVNERAEKFERDRDETRHVTDRRKLAELRKDISIANAGVATDATQAAAIEKAGDSGQPQQLGQTAPERSRAAWTADYDVEELPERVTYTRERDGAGRGGKITDHGEKISVRGDERAIRDAVALAKERYGDEIGLTSASERGRDQMLREMVRQGVTVANPEHQEAYAQAKLDVEREKLVAANGKGPTQEREAVGAEPKHGASDAERQMKDPSKAQAEQDKAYLRSTDHELSSEQREHQSRIASHLQRDMDKRNEPTLRELRAQNGRHHDEQQMREQVRSSTPEAPKSSERQSTSQRSESHAPSRKP
jgi:arsenate reductase-like glutaredoxin family protein